MAIMDTAGTLVKIGSTTIGHATNVRTNAGTRSERDQTDLSHTDYRRVTLGMRGPGGFTFDMILDPSDTGQIALQALYANKGSSAFTVAWPNSITEVMASGMVVSIERTAEVDADAKATVTIMATGAVTGWPVS